MKPIKVIINIVWRWTLFILAIIILLKVHMANNIHCTLRQDPMEQWMAIALAYLLINETMKGDK